MSLAQSMGPSARESVQPGLTGPVTEADMLVSFATQFGSDKLFRRSLISSP